LSSLWLWVIEVLFGRHSEKKLSDCAWQKTAINPQITQIEATRLGVKVTS